MKKIKICCLLFVLLFSVNTMCFARSDEEVIKIINEANIMNGTENGFEPEKILTRAEVAAILVRTKDLDDNTKSVAQFEDVDSNHWANSYIAKAFNARIVDGTGENKFSPERQVTMAELVTMVMRAVADRDEIESTGTWPNNYIDFAKEHTFLEGIDKKCDNLINRMDTARLIVNVLESDKWDNQEDEKEKEETEPTKAEESNKIIKSVVKIGVILSVAQTADDYALVELATPAGIVEYRVHESELETGMLMPGTYVDFWLSGDRMWDLDGEKVTGLDNENTQMAKIYSFGDGFLRMLKKDTNEAEFIDTGNVIFLECDSTKFEGGVRTFEDLRLGSQSDIKLGANSDKIYAEMDADEVFYHVAEDDDIDKIIAIIYVKD